MYVAFDSPWMKSRNDAGSLSRVIYVCRVCVTHCGLHLGTGGLGSFCGPLPTSTLLGKTKSKEDNMKSNSLASASPVGTSLNELPSIHHNPRFSAGITMCLPAKPVYHHQAPPDPPAWQSACDHPLTQLQPGPATGTAGPTTPTGTAGPITPTGTDGPTNLAGRALPSW